MAKRKNNEEVKTEIKVKIDKRKNNPNIGRPKFVLTAEMRDKIFYLIETTSAGIKQICRENKDLPSHDTVFCLINSDKEFSDLYLAAKQKQITAHMEETYTLADDIPDEAYYIDERGNRRIDAGWSSHNKQRIELRKWNAARLAPRLYGDKMQNETTVTMKSFEEKLKDIIGGD